jgi:hypothetical protein
MLKACGSQGGHSANSKVLDFCMVSSMMHLSQYALGHLTKRAIVLDSQYRSPHPGQFGEFSLSN